MSSDLISREALKKALKEYKYCGFYDKVIEIIDNAPTITPQALYNGIVDIINKNGLTTVDELLEILKKGANNNE